MVTYVLILFICPAWTSSQYLYPLRSRITKHVHIIVANTFVFLWLLTRPVKKEESSSEDEAPRRPAKKAPAKKTKAKAKRSSKSAPKKKGKGKEKEEAGPPKVALSSKAMRIEQVGT